VFGGGFFAEGGSGGRLVGVLGGCGYAYGQQHQYGKLGFHGNSQD
jgi:hypothetical protein